MTENIHSLLSTSMFLQEKWILHGKLLVLGEGRDIQFFKPCEVQHLKIGYGFKIFSMNIF